MGFTVWAMEMEFVEVIQLLPQDCIQGWLAEQTLDFAVPPTKEDLAEAAASGGHPREHCGALLVPLIIEKIAVVSQALLQERIQEHIMEQTVAFLVSQIKEIDAVVCVSGFCHQEHVHEHVVEPTVVFLVPQIKENTAEVFEFRLIVEPSFPRSVVGSVRSVQSVQPDVMTNVKTPFCLRLKGPCGSVRRWSDGTVTHDTSAQVKMSQGSSSEAAKE